MSNNNGVRIDVLQSQTFRDSLRGDAIEKDNLARHPRLAATGLRGGGRIYTGDKSVYASVHEFLPRFCGSIAIQSRTHRLSERQVDTFCRIVEEVRQDVERRVAEAEAICGNQEIALWAVRYLHGRRGKDIRWAISEVTRFKAESDAKAAAEAARWEAYRRANNFVRG